MSHERIEVPTPGIFIFVGENRSKTAQEKGYSWYECQRTGKPVQCAIPLFRAITNAGLNPREQIFFNLWDDEWRENEMVFEILKEFADSGEVIIGMGQKVQKKLKELGIPFRPMIHPAALGKIRKAELYDAHVSTVLY